MATPETCRGIWCPSLGAILMPGLGLGEAEGERQYGLMQLTLQCRPCCCPTQRVDTLCMSYIETCNLLSVIRAVFSTFQILGTFLLWPILAQNYTGEEIPSQFSLLHTIYSSLLTLSIVCNFLFCPLLY